MATLPQLPGNPPGLGWCGRCGRRIQWRTTRWVHQRPQPSGAPHDHNAEPVAVRPMFHATPLENFQGIVDAEALLLGADGYVYLANTPEWAAGFIPDDEVVVLIVDVTQLDPELREHAFTGATHPLAERLCLPDDLVVERFRGPIPVAALKVY